MEEEEEEKGILFPSGLALLQMMPKHLPALWPYEHCGSCGGTKVHSIAFDVSHV